jgi:hypothetical protein
MPNLYTLPAGGFLRRFGLSTYFQSFLKFIFKERNSHALSEY